MAENKMDVQFEVKLLADGTGIFEGYASVFNVVDLTNDNILQGAFKKSLEKFKKENNFPPMLWQHDTANPIGAWREMREDKHGLFVKGELFIKDIPRAKEAYKLLKEKVITGLSIGYRATKWKKDEEKKTRILEEVDLGEVSLVTFPANEKATISKIKANKKFDNDKNNRKNEQMEDINMTFDEIKKNAIVLNDGQKAELSKLLGGNAELETKTAEFKQENDALQKKLETSQVETKEVQKKLDMQTKEMEFAVLLTKGTAVPAQKKSYMEGNMAEFVKLVVPVNLEGKGTGSGDEGKDAPKTAEEAEKKMAVLAEKKRKEDKDLSFLDAVNLVREENPALDKFLD